ncbi:MAG: hypothetical protein ABIR71_02400 [Chthoniobacterales bacterium]
MSTIRLISVSSNPRRAPSNRPANCTNHSSSSTPAGAAKADGGHLYGTTLAPEEKENLLEYLKTL